MVKFNFIQSFRTWRFLFRVKSLGQKTITILGYVVWLISFGILIFGIARLPQGCTLSGYILNFSNFLESCNASIEALVLGVIGLVVSSLVSVLKHRHAKSMTHEYWIRDMDRFDAAFMTRVLAGIRVHLLVTHPTFEMFELSKGTLVTSPPLNEALLSEKLDVPFRVDSSTRWLAYNRALGGLTKAETEALKRFVVDEAHKSDRRVSSDPKIRMASELVFDKSNNRFKAACLPIWLQETDYLSSMMTDQISFKHVGALGNGDETTLYDGISFFSHEEPGNGGYSLTRFENNSLSNQIGASTLAFTSDGFLLLVEQTKENLQSPGRLVPSASGSLDWADIGGKMQGDLLEVIRIGAGRELVEECGLHALGHARHQRPIKFNMIVYAYGRYMVDRGGKPEFFCLARLDARHDEMAARRHTRHERHFTKRVVPYEHKNISIADSRPIATQLCDLCNDVPQHFSASVAYPLEFALFVVKQACSTRESAAVIERFFAPA